MEPEQPHWMPAYSRIRIENTGQTLVSVEPKPVVEMVETTVKKLCRSASQTFGIVPLVTRLAATSRAAIRIELR